MDEHSLKALSGLFSNFSQVFLASLVVPVLGGRFDFDKIPSILLGIVATLGFAYYSTVFAQKGNL